MTFLKDKYLVTEYLPLIHRLQAKLCPSKIHTLKSYASVLQNVTIFEEAVLIKSDRCPYKNRRF